MKTVFIMLGMFLAGMATMAMWVRSMFNRATKTIADHMPQI